jgi:hypothetical protein
MGDMRYADKILVENPEWKRQLRRPGCKWENNIKTDLREMRLRMWIGFIWLRTGTGSGHM